jgi:hypothetical protein
MRDVEAIHAAYCKATGNDPRDLPLNLQREMLIGYWITYGKGSRGEPWGVQDLLYVIGHIKRGIASQSRQPGALRFNNLFGQLDRFEEDLAECMKRIRRVPASGGSAPVRRQADATPSGEVDGKAIKQGLTDFRRKLGGGQE